MLADVIRRASAGGAVIEKIHVASGVFANTSGSVTINLPSTFSPARSFCILETIVSDNVQFYALDGVARADLAADGNSVTIYRSSANVGCRYSIFVVCLKNARVQKINASIDSSTTTHDVTIPVALKSAAKTFAFYSYTFGSVDWARVFHPSSFPNTTTLRLTRTGTASGTGTYIFYIVELE